MLTQKQKIKLDLLKLLIFKERFLMPDKMKALDNTTHFKFIWGGRWGGKSISVCKKLLQIADSRRVRILCTRDIKESIDDSFKADLENLIYELQYENFKITGKEIINTKTGAVFIFKGLQFEKKKQTTKSLSQIDICVIEESQTVKKDSIDILYPTIRKAGSQIWFVYNKLFPDDPVELLRQSIADNEKTEININCFDNPYLSEEAKKDIARLKEQYDKGENQDYLHIVLGEPLGFSPYTVFTSKEIQDAIDRRINDEGETVVGIDLARMGGDKIIFIKRKGLKMIDYKMFPVIKGDILLNEIITFINNDTSIRINIDETGIAGGYIVDFLHSKGFRKATSISFGQSAHDSDKYNNAITEMWFEFKNKINDIQLMNIPELKSQLITREYKYDNKERKCIEPKDSYKKRGYKSPDFADALLLCYYNTGLWIDSHVIIKKRL